MSICKLQNLKWATILSLFALVSCGGTEHTVSVEPPESDIVSGETYNYVIIRLEFLQDLERLCRSAILESDFDSAQLYEQAVSQCVFDNLSVVDVANFQEFEDTVCSLDLEELTQEELEACELLGGL